MKDNNRHSKAASGSDFDRVRGFLLDMDGTFYLSDHLLPGAAAFLRYTGHAGIPVQFLTNNSSKSAAVYAQKIAAMGLDVPASQILTSGEATAQYLQARAPGARVAVFGTPELEQEFHRCGFTRDMQAPAYVVLGFDQTIDYAKLTRLCDLVRAGLPYIATHPDFNCPVAGGFVPDIGAIMAFVEASTGRRADVVIGKPNPHIVEMAAVRLGLPVEALCMVGDRLYTDIAMGQNAPIQTALVLSGETQPGDITDSPFKPDYVFENLAALVAALEAGTGMAGASKFSKPPSSV
ncbi:MAG: HAD-IIA family hydrolase [Anaerolineae bacterium]|nr:HAD-IIA family hydrolase [Anaerolineae bacterium]